MTTNNQRSAQRGIRKRPDGGLLPMTRDDTSDSQFAGDGGGELRHIKEFQNAGDVHELDETAQIRVGGLRSDASSPFQRFIPPRHPRTTCIIPVPVIPTHWCPTAQVEQLPEVQEASGQHAPEAGQAKQELLRLLSHGQAAAHEQTPPRLDVSAAMYVCGIAFGGGAVLVLLLAHADFLCIP